MQPTPNHAPSVSLSWGMYTSTAQSHPKSKTPITKRNLSREHKLQHVSNHSPTYLRKTPNLIMSADFSRGTLECPKIPGIHIMEHPRSRTHAATLTFSQGVYETLLEAYGPIPDVIKVPSDRSTYSFAVLEWSRCYSVISITETGGQLSNITINLDGTVTTLNKDNFCRIPGCGYWVKKAGWLPRHRLTHFADRGFQCQNPHRKGTGAPKNLECQLDPGQYITRLDLFKKHFEAPNCRSYTPSFVRRKFLWHGSGHVDEIHLLPFTRDVHIPFKFRSSKSRRLSHSEAQ